MGQENNTKKLENLATTNFGQWFCMIFYAVTYKDVKKLSIFADWP
jgi:uncharacterized membrane protein YjjP (DUF1212 family)